MQTSLAIGNLLLLIFVIVEGLLIKYYLKEKLPWKELILNLNSGHILLWVFRGIEVALYFYTVKYLSLQWAVHLPYWMQWVIAFILWDFCFYWLHRTHHYFRILWNVHVVHHEGEHFSLSLGIRNSWYSSLTSYPFFIGMAIIGFPTEIFLTVSSIHYFFQFYNHNHIIKKSGWLEYFLVTPSHHRVHHGKNSPYFNKNFAGTFVFWDKMFGTFQAELLDNPVEFGTNHSSESLNPILVNNMPFLKRFDFSKKLKTKNVPIFHISNFILVSGCVMLFTLLLFFIYFENILDYNSKLTLFCIVFLGTIGNGLLSENRWIGILVWIIATIVLPIFYLYNFHIPLLLFKAMLLIFISHGFFTLFWTTLKLISNAKLKF